MRKIIVLLIFSLALGATGCPVLRTESSKAPVAYSPPVVGDKWVIESDYGDLLFEDIHEVTAVENKSGAHFVSILVKPKQTEDPGKLVFTKTCATGTYLLQEGKVHYDPPVHLLPAPIAAIKEGDRWQFEKPGVIKWSFTAGKEEEIEVPAGKFKARRIQGEGESEGIQVKCIQWIAPGYPTIKRLSNFGDETLIVEVLKSFTPCKR